MNLTNDPLRSPDRLAAIAGSDLIEAGAIAALDRLTQMAARLLRVPVAQLNVLTADQQVPVSHVGGDAWGSAVGLERSFCQHVIRSGVELRVPDAREHLLVRESPATAESGIVGYLSVPILSPRAASPIATLCVVDYEARVWTQQEMETLRDLAAWATSEIELRAEYIRAAALAEEALQTSEARLRLALEAAELGDWELDLRTMGSPRRSRRHDEIFGYSVPVGDWSYQRFLEHVHPEDRPEVDLRFQAALERGEAWAVECRIHRRDGEQRWIWGRGKVHHDRAGKPSHALGIIADITDRKDAESALSVARGEAEAASQAKSQFLATMSHELRTPINAMLGYADLIRAELAGPVTHQQQEYLERVRSSGFFLIGLVDQVLSFSRIQAGQEIVQLNECDLTALLREVASVVEPAAAKRGLEFRVAVPDHPFSLMTDGSKVKQIVFNLLSNAVKFTEEGFVELQLTAEEERVRIAVRDTGPGIPPDQVGRIFQPFMQLDQSSTRTKGGSGLGLTVSASLAALIGGTLEVHSTPSNGSTFTFSVPLDASNTGAAETPW